MLVATNVATGVGLLMAPELADLLGRAEDPTLLAYEQKILDLRLEVDRLHSRQFRQTGDLNLQMQELAQQQQFLAEQHSFVRILAQKAEQLGLSPVAEADQVASLVPATQALETPPVPGSVQEYQLIVDQMVTDTRLALSALAASADQSTDEILAGLRSIGVRPTLPSFEEGGVGGPFMPAETGAFEQSLAEEANRVLISLERFSVARETLSDLPVHYPFAEQERMTSRFGNRADPFGGGNAFHSGLDFGAPQGTAVLATGGGKVVFAGRNGGYGNMVEIEHNGINTRYAHLSAVNVSVGQVVVVGQVIGKVGSTGRSTGPHLHYEVRVNDEPRNPLPFLNISTRLSDYLI